MFILLYILHKSKFKVPKPLTSILRNSLAFDPTRHGCDKRVSKEWKSKRFLIISFVDAKPYPEARPMMPRNHR